MRLELNIKIPRGTDNLRVDAYRSQALEILRQHGYDLDIKQKNGSYEVRGKVRGMLDIKYMKHEIESLGAGVRVYVSMINKTRH